jgi:hypothetical protein
MSVFGLNLPSWRDEVAQVVETLIKAQWFCFDGVL